MTPEIVACGLAVIGAGPAGLAAARAGAESGIEVICIDRFDRPGGQYHMQPTVLGTPFAQAVQVREGQQAVDDCKAVNVRFLTGAELFWAEPREPSGQFRLHLLRDGKAVVIETKTLIAANGAIERSMPFPGWTLPGVIGAGAAQRLLKTSGDVCALPFSGKTVLAGTGPFLLAVAATFAKADQRIDHFVEIQSTAPLKKVSALLRHPTRIPEAVSLLYSLSRTGAKRHMGAVVTRATGKGRLNGVEIAPLDKGGTPDLHRAVTVEDVGTLCIGFGFQPTIDLTTALGAAHKHDISLGGWYCATDPVTGATSVGGLYAAGEVAGLGGAEPARLSGRLAGLHAAATIAGRNLEHNRTVSNLAARLRAARAFAATLARLYPMPQRFPLPLNGDEIVCRCEDVTLSQIRRAIAEGAQENFAIKMWTRAGMGLCQGRNCGAGIAAALSEAGVDPEQSGYNRSHFPLYPVSSRVAKDAFDCPRREEAISKVSPIRS